MIVTKRVTSKWRADGDHFVCTACRNTTEHPGATCPYCWATMEGLMWDQNE